MGDDLQETRPTRASVRNASVARGKRVMMRRAGGSGSGRGLTGLVEAADDGFDGGGLAWWHIEKNGTFVIVGGGAVGKGVAPEGSGFAVFDVTFHGLTNELEDLITLHAGGDAGELAFGELLAVSRAALAVVFDAGPGFRPRVTVGSDIPRAQEDGRGDKEEGDDEIPVFLHEAVKGGRLRAMGN